MKVTFTFEYADLLAQLEKTLAMNGVRPLVDDQGNKQIRFDSKQKQVVVHCEAAPLPTACPFCQAGVHQDITTKRDDSTENKEALDDEATTINDPQATEEVEENAPMSLAQLKAQSRALSRKDGPIKVHRDSEAHAALAEPALMPGESAGPPEGDDF